VRYPSRVEVVQADGSGRAVLVDDARQPAPSPDGSQVAYVRSSAVGSALLLRGLGVADERELVPATRFPDLAYPRFSPRGDQIAFMAAAPFVGRQAGPPLLASFGLVGSTAAYAHGLPWDLWMVGLDGAPPRLVAQLGGDDASPVWSPDGSQIFVYSGTGSAIVDASTGEVASYPYLAGYGATAWVPLTEP
jgi:Tol biopolymer transport system component